MNFDVVHGAQETRARNKPSTPPPEGPEVPFFLGGLGGWFTVALFSLLFDVKAIFIGMDGGLGLEAPSQSDPLASKVLPKDEVTLVLSSIFRPSPLIFYLGGYSWRDSGY